MTEGRGSIGVLFRGSGEESAELARLFVDHVRKEGSELECELRVMEVASGPSTWVVARSTGDPSVDDLIAPSLARFNATVGASADAFPMREVERFRRAAAKKSTSGVKSTPERPAARSAAWTLVSGLDEAEIVARIGALGAGTSVTLSGLHATAGERLLHILGLEVPGFIVQWQCLSQAEYEFFLVGRRSRLGVVELRHDNGELDEMPERFVASIEQVASALRTFVASGERASSLDWELTEDVDSR